MLFERELWYKNAIIYNLDVETFMDSDGDGIGDFKGLIRHLDYLASLGVTCLWLLPFYPSPNRDNGYDVTDYYGVDPRLGSLGDFVEFSHHARERGMRVLVDLVINHTSIEHPWFQAAREDPSSRFRDYYVWSEEKPSDADEDLIFPGVQESKWTYDDKVGAYYYHRFYKHQPDLNIGNPAVMQEITRIMGFWLQLGVSGFRMDAAPYVIELTGVKNPPVDDKHCLLQALRDYVSWRRGDAILLAEADVALEELPEYFGSGDRMHMLFNFLLNQNIFLAMAQEDAGPIVKAMQSIPRKPGVVQWANFLRNHDELDLERLSEDEREQVFRHFGPEETMQIYHRGLRRRLAPMLQQDRRRMELAFSLLFGLPGTPVMRYGQEIGMGEDLSLEERNSVRTPMQWSAEKNGGFSTAPPDQLIRPVIDEGAFSYEQVNVAEQRAKRDSLLNWVSRLIQVRKECPELGSGSAHLVDSDESAVVALRAESDGSVVITLHNLSDRKVNVRLKTDDDLSQMQEMLADRDYPPLSEVDGALELDPYGYRWMRKGQKVLLL